MDIYRILFFALVGALASVATWDRPRWVTISFCVACALTIRLGQHVL